MLKTRGPVLSRALVLVAALAGVLFVLLVPRTAFAKSAGMTSDPWNYTGAQGCTQCHAGLVGDAPSVVSFSNPLTNLAAPSGTLFGNVNVAYTYTLTVDLGDRS